MRPSFRLSLVTCRFVAAMLLCVAGVALPPAHAADARKAVDPTAAEMQRALDAAAREARGTDDLDPAYELLSMVDTAQQLRAPQIAAGASAAFTDLVGRAATAVAKRPGSAARDALDQFVDLRSAAYNAPEAQIALDKALASLFPVVVGVVEKSITAATAWDEKLERIADLGQLQASATQVKMMAAAAGIGTTFDAEIAKLRKANEQESDDALRTQRIKALDDTARSRLDHVADATANNIDVMASRMQTSSSGAPFAGATPAASVRD